MKKILFLIVALSATLNMSANAPAVSVGAAKPVVLVDEPTTAQEWYNKLGQTIMTVEANLSKLSDSDAKTQLTIAYNNANELYLAEYGPEKLEEYKDAYIALWKAYQDAIKVDVAVQVSVLGSAIGSAETTKDVVLVGADFKDQLQGYIDAATTIEGQYSGKSEFAISDISYLKGYITSFNSNVQGVISDDIDEERDLLNLAIEGAESYESNIEDVSKLIADALGDAIAEAKPVAEDLTSTARELNSERGTFNTKYKDCKDSFDRFKEAKTNLNKTIKAANDFCVTIMHTPIFSVLYQSITTAQGVYDDAINKTTDDLEAEKGNLEGTQTVAKEAEAVAVDIDVWIANARHALLSIEDDDIKGQINNAIDDAEKALAEKSAKVDLDSALKTLKEKTEEYIKEDIKKACEDLKGQIDAADDKLINVIAYDEFYSQLLDARKAANDVYEAHHIAEEIVEATETLRLAISEIVEADDQKAIGELDGKLADAQSKYITVNADNTTLAGDLKTKIDEANALDATATAKVRKAAADALTLAIKAADNAYKMFLANKKALEDEKAAAESTLTNNIAGTHTGIKTALSSAISDADGVLGTETIRTKTNAEISQAVDALKNAHQGAKDAEVQALVLDEKISLAEEALTKIGYFADYEGLNLAINSAKELYNNPLKIAIDYYNAWNNLDTAMTSYVEDDIIQGRNALGNAIGSAGTALTDTLVNDSYKTIVENAIETAGNVEADKTADRAALDLATSELLSTVRNAVDADLDAEKEILLAAVNDAKSALKPYQDMAKKVTNTDDAKNAFNVAVVNPFNSLISAADKVRKNTKSTSKQMDAQVTILSEGESEMVAAYDNLYKSEEQNFFATYLKERALAAKVNKENNVIVGLHNSAWQKGIALNEKLNGTAPEACTYADIINVRIPMDKECDDLNNEFLQWQTYCSSLASLKGNAQTWKDDLKEEGPEAPIGTALQEAIDAADQIVVADKKATEMETAYNNLNDAFETAKNNYNTQYWDFTDTNSEIKAGTYDSQHARYTRSSTYIAANNYATFCMPMNITVDDQFLKVYTPESFAILNGTTLKLFLTEVAQGKEIEAGTPFLAELACKGKLVLKNNAELEVNETSSPKKKKTIKVYQQSGESSFVTYDKNIHVYWCGTFQKETELANKWGFDIEGEFGPTGSISAFRAYIQQDIVVGTSNGKAIEAIEVDFGDGSETTGIRSIMMGSSDGSQIFSIDGKKMGNDMNSLNKGVYIINGKKVLK